MAKHYSNRVHAAQLQTDSLFTRLKKKYGRKNKIPKYLLNRSSFRILCCITDLVDYAEFTRVFNLPDTFHSWFKVTELHIWMLMVKLYQSDEYGKFMVYRVLKFLWQDVGARAKKLVEGSGRSFTTAHYRDIDNHFKASLLAYDEALLGHDAVLASALWMRFFREHRTCDDPEKLEMLVHYVRKQMHHIDKQDLKAIISNGWVTFLPLDPTASIDSDKQHQMLTEIAYATHTMMMRW